MLYILIATANYADSEIIRQQVRNELDARSLLEGKECIVRELATRDTLQRYLIEKHFIQPGTKLISEVDKTVEVDKSGGAGHVLVIAQPTLTGSEDAKPVLAKLLKNHEKSVILLQLNNASAGRLQIGEERKLFDLGKDALTKLANLVGEFLKQHESFDYVRSSELLKEYKKKWLAPREGSRDSAQSNNNDHNNVFDKIKVEWEALIKRYQDRAETTFGIAIDRLVETNGKSDDDLLALTCAYLYLWVEARLCLVRATSNYKLHESAPKERTPKPSVVGSFFAPPGWGINQTERAKVRADINKILTEYRDALKNNDKILIAKTSGQSYFMSKSGDAEQFRAWSEDFGSKHVNRVREPGWVIHAENVGSMLFLEYRKALGREYWHDRSTWILALLYWLYWVVAGYGFLPGRALLLGLDVLWGGLMAHLVDDYAITKCASAPAVWHGGQLLRTIVSYLGISASSLTSLGATSSPCGDWHGLISAAESLTGYFLLAILTTLLVQSIIEQ